MKAPVSILTIFAITASFFTACATKRPQRGRSGLIEITQAYENKHIMSKSEAVAIIRECLQNAPLPTNPVVGAHAQCFASIDPNGYVYDVKVYERDEILAGGGLNSYRWSSREKVTVTFSEITKLLLLRVANQTNPDKLVFLLRSSDGTPNRRPQVKILNRPSADVLSALLTLCPNVK